MNGRHGARRTASLQWGRSGGQLLLTDVGTILGTCLSGAGIAQIKAIGIPEFLQSGRLVDLFPDWPTSGFRCMPSILRVICRPPRFAPSSSS
jgi:DNA-binding transcriptional LysR family regulator